MREFRRSVTRARAAALSRAFIASLKKSEQTLILKDKTIGGSLQDVCLDAKSPAEVKARAELAKVRIPIKPVSACDKSCLLHLQKGCISSNKFDNFDFSGFAVNSAARSKHC